MKRPPELGAAIAHLYEVFAGYPRRDVIDACPCCNAKRHIPPNKPLRNLTASELDGYAFSVLFTVGDAYDFRTFLPRILELTLGENPEHVFLVDVEIHFGHLAYAKWRDWPKSEQEAIEHFCMQAWKYVLKSSPLESEPGIPADWLCGIARAQIDLAPYLGEWGDDNSIDSALHLVELIMLDEEQLKSGILEGFWEDAPAQWNQLSAWLRGDAVRGKIREALKRLEDPNQIFEAEHSLTLLNDIS